MRFATISAALAFAASAIAQTAGFDAITNPTQWEKVAAGKPFTIKWQPGDVKGTVTIGLIGGTAQNKQVPLSTIASGVDNQAGTYTWAVDATLGKDAVYGLQITLDSDKSTFQYSFPFNIEAGEGAASAPTSSSAAAPSAPATTSAKEGYEAEPIPTKPASSTEATEAPSTMPAPTYAASSLTSAVPSTTLVSKPTASYPASNMTASASGSSTLSTATTSASATSSIVPVSGAGRTAAGSLLAGGVAVLAAFL